VVSRAVLRRFRADIARFRARFAGDIARFRADFAGFCGVLRWFRGWFRGGIARFRGVSRGFTSFRTYSLALYRKVLQVYQAQSVEELSCKGILDGHLLLVCTCIANEHIV
jgi:hypothetical protein